MKGIEALIGGAIVGGTKAVDERVESDREFEREFNREIWLQERKAQIDALRLQQSHNLTLQQNTHSSDLRKGEADYEQGLIGMRETEEERRARLQAKEEWDAAIEEGKEFGLTGERLLEHGYRRTGTSMTGYGSGRSGSSGPSGGPLDPIRVIQQIEQTAQNLIAGQFSKGSEEEKLVTSALRQAGAKFRETGKLDDFNFDVFFRAMDNVGGEATSVARLVAAVKGYELYGRAPSEGELESLMRDYVGDSVPISRGSTNPAAQAGGGEMTPEEMSARQARMQSALRELNN